jgi:Fanconi anemia group M protein
LLGEKRYVQHSFLKPRAVEERLYQTRIIDVAKRKNSLVVLPTALGKTVIALLLAIEKCEEGKIYFLAPTRPLVQQHHQTFVEKTFFDENELVLVTGHHPPEKRKILYGQGRIIFATPQCIYNDLRSGFLRLNDASLIIFDEAHRARGNYSYVGIAQYYFRQCSRPLVLGLTASPGGSEEKIAEVCRNLGIEAIEHRLDEDKDVKPYIQPIDVQWRRVKLPECYIQVRDRLREMLIERVKMLQSLGVLTDKQPAFITRRDLVELNEELQRRIGGGEGGYLYQIKFQATATLSIAHMIELIETQGPETLQAFIEKSLRKMAFEGSRGHKSIVEDPAFLKAKNMLKTCVRAENPKMAEVSEILKEQLQTKPDSRVIVFTQYRDTVRAITKTLKEKHGFEAIRFVGQGEREGDPGMNQEQQREALEKLRSGEAKILVATSIAEEGLDIPEVDHVIFYEPVPSEIRYIQRRGRTGRRVAGKVTILIAEDTIDEAFYWSSISRARKMKRIISQLNRKLPQMLRERHALTAEPTLTKFIDEQKAYEPQKETEITLKPSKPQLWAPQTIHTKGLSQALKWLSENIPEKPTPIKTIVEMATEETGLDKAAVETAIWRMAQQGLLYQPEPGKIKKL